MNATSADPDFEYIQALAEAGITLSGEDTNINFYPEREVYKEDISLLLHLLLFLFLFFIDVLLFQHLWFLQFCYPAPI
ncbi:unnamed protein product [Brassica oleracea var. botrytis]